MPYHRFKVEEATGQRIRRGYVVHHKNGIKTDNRIENLEVMTAAAHRKHHREWRKRKRVVKRIMRQNRVIARRKRRK